MLFNLDGSNEEHQRGLTLYNSDDREGKKQDSVVPLISK